jgi:hypothetical protein
MERRQNDSNVWNQTLFHVMWLTRFAREIKPPRIERIERIERIQRIERSFRKFDKGEVNL